MDASADAAPSDQLTTRSNPPVILASVTQLPARTPGEVLARALAGYPATLLWEGLRELLPLDVASIVFDATAGAALTARA